MKQKTLSVLLTVAGAIACLGVGLVFFVFAPVLGAEARDAVPEYAPLFWPGMIYLWAIAACYLTALVCYFRVSARIGQNRSFCMENVRSMRAIFVAFTAAAALWLAGIAAWFLLPYDLGPGWLYVALFALASGAVALLAYALSGLLLRAARLQEDSDLTV
ncbi:MAG: DUF2975 domain-containing protein [Clostridia bacterium]|nr:DUF2975 domain-containing protein [Clostridia bacterium]